MFIPGNQSQNDLRIWARNVGTGAGASGACARLRYIAGSGAGAAMGAGSAEGAGSGSEGWGASEGCGAGVGSCCSIFALFFDYAAKLEARMAEISTNRAPTGRLTLVFSCTGSPKVLVGAARGPWRAGASGRGRRRCRRFPQGFRAGWRASAGVAADFLRRRNACRRDMW